MCRDMVSHNPQKPVSDRGHKNPDSRNLELDSLELERLILEMTAAGAGITADEIDQLYQDTSDELRRLLVRKLGDEESAEALARDTYRKLIRIKHNQDVGDLRRYLFCMAVRLALNVLRKRKLDSEHYACSSSQTLSSGDGSAYRVLLDELRQDSLKESLSQLPDRTRYIFLLHHFKKMNRSDIAHRLNISRSMVDTHIGCAQGQASRALSEFALANA